MKSSSTAFSLAVVTNDGFVPVPALMKSDLAYLSRKNASSRLKNSQFCRNAESVSHSEVLQFFAPSNNSLRRASHLDVIGTSENLHGGSGSRAMNGTALGGCTESGGIRACSMMCFAKSFDFSLGCVNQGFQSSPRRCLKRLPRDS